MNKSFFKNKTILITGGTGSLGKKLVKNAQVRCKENNYIFKEMSKNNIIWLEIKILIQQKTKT